MWSKGTGHHYIGPPRTPRYVPPAQAGRDANTEGYKLPTIETPDIDRLPGRVIFSKLWGSYSHNTALPSSDQDYLMVYAAPTRDVLSLHPPVETVDGKNPDFEAHEVAKFCRLLMKGNPSMIECLFTERMCNASPEWGELAAERQRFLSQRVVAQYLGYGLGQLKRFDVGSRLHTKGGKQNEKWLYHMIRVLLDARRIAQGGEPVVWKEGEERETLMRIRSGAIHHENVVVMARTLIAETDALKPWPLPELGDDVWLNNWLLNIRLNQNQSS